MPESNLKLLYLQREKKKGGKKKKGTKNKKVPLLKVAEKSQSNHASKMTHIPTVAPLIYNTTKTFLGYNQIMWDTRNAGKTQVKNIQ